ncbi:hypothetical protein Bpfe_018094, partial [Biomphalaria pfeifferi]
DSDWFVGLAVTQEICNINWSRQQKIVLRSHHSSVTGDGYKTREGDGRTMSQRCELD